MNTYSYLLIWMVLVKLLWPLPYLNCLPQQSSHCVPLALFSPRLSPSLAPSNFFLYALAFFIPVAKPWLPPGRRTPSLFSKSSLSVMHQGQGSVRCSSPAGAPTNHYSPTLLQTTALSDHAIHERTCHSFIPSLTTTACPSLGHSLHSLNVHVLVFLPAQLFPSCWVTVTVNFLVYFLGLLIINILYFNSISILEYAISWNFPP